MRRSKQILDHDRPQSRIGKIDDEGASALDVSSGNSFADIRYMVGVVTNSMAETTGFQGDHPVWADRSFSRPSVEYQEHGVYGDRCVRLPADSAHVLGEGISVSVDFSIFGACLSDDPRNLVITRSGGCAVWDVSTMLEPRPRHA